MALLLGLHGARAQCIAGSLLSGSAAINATVAGGISWSGASNASSSDDAYAVAAALLPGDVSNYLVVTGFNFSVPLSATICGIMVEVERGVAGVFPNVTDNVVRLLKAGTLTGTNQASGTAWPAADSYTSYGAGNALWGATWLPLDVNAATFGVAISINLSGVLLPIARIDHVRMQVYYTTTPLPIELAEFEVQRSEGRVAQLGWVTATERNSDFFEVQRSLDGERWQALGRVKGAGNSYQRNTYAFTDAYCPGELCYFRLKQYDTDGSAQHSPVRSLPPEKQAAGSFLVEQDEGSGCLRVYAEAGIVSLSLVDLEGMKQEEIRPGPGTLSLMLPVEAKSKGLYVLNLVDEHSAVCSKKILIR